MDPLTLAALALVGAIASDQVESGSNLAHTLLPPGMDPRIGPELGTIPHTGIGTVTGPSLSRLSAWRHQRTGWSTCMTTFTQGTMMSRTSRSLPRSGEQGQSPMAGRPHRKERWWAEALTLLQQPHPPAKKTWEEGPFILRMELWSEECLWEGVGDWENRGVATTLEERRWEYQEEFELRCQLPSYDPDAPPPNAGGLVFSEWRDIDPPIASSPYYYEMVQLSVWKRAP